MKLRRRPAGDEGTTLMELMVTMGVMGVLGLLFTAAVLQVFKTTSVTDSLSEAQRELAVAFQRFDRQLRYASWIADPGKIGTTQYVEFAGPVTTDCYQLRLAPSSDGLGVLQLVTWTLGSPPAANARGQTVASQVVMDSTTPPFSKQAYGAQPYASAGANTTGGDFKSVFQRLRVQLTTRVASGTAQIDTTFTALNTSNLTPATNGCSEGRPK
ncbi:hypothetical protein [Actinoplanes sp. TFC3]|uniref:hypothetical protein n=1 Tax=Actinoplanes sp. TFC3 TaxID=1710355 RepID=UPI00082955DD|nr:hypothetical protein [Actinoplanes sp. TFC3]